MRQRLSLLAAIVACAGLATACSATEEEPLPMGAEPVRLDPGDFGSEVQNPYWPLEPGSKWVYREADAEGNAQRVEVTVTAETRTILGIEARVVHDLVTEDGEPVEDTFDWYAVDRSGNIWYLGEDTKEFENGKVVSTKGSWEAGVDGAQPGIALPGDPRIGLSYRQEYYEGEAEDAAEVLSVTKSVRVPFGSFDEVLQTKDFTPLEPDLVEHKFYAKGVGPVRAVTVSGGSDREELVEFTHP
jgi:hypothetical protein